MGDIGRRFWWWAISVGNTGKRFWWATLVVGDFGEATLVGDTGGSDFGGRFRW